MAHAANKISEPNILKQSFIDPDNPRNTSLRWIFLFFCCMMTFGSYFGVEVPNNLQIYIEEYFNTSTTAFNTFASLFYIPCTFMPLIGGILSTKIGLNKGLVLFAALIMIGEFLIGVGVSENNFNIMLIGRFLHGSGHDSLLVLKKVIISKWFLNQELSFAIGLGLCVSRLGSSLSGYFTPFLFSTFESLSVPFYISSLLSLISLLCVGAVIIIDNHAEEYVNKKDNILQTKESFQFADLKRMTFIQVILILSFCLLYPPFFVYLTNNSAILMIRFGFDHADATRCNSLIYTIATILTPLIGYFSDKFDRKAVILLTSGLIQMIAHIFFLFIGDSESGNSLIYLPVVLMGLFYAGFGSMFWPSLTILTEEKMRASVFGITYAGLNSVVSLMLLATGNIKDKTEHMSGGYFWTQIFLALISLIGCCLLFMIKQEDEVTGSNLERGSYKELLTEAVPLRKSLEYGIEFTEVTAQRKTL